MLKKVDKSATKIMSFCITAFLVVGVLFCSAAKTSAAKPEPASAVSYTAPITLYWLAKAGVPEAVEYVQYIDAEKILKPKSITDIGNTRQQSAGRSISRMPMGESLSRTVQPKLTTKLPMLIVIC